MQLSAIDLNLLVVMGALLDTRSVKGAAARLGLSPSATSHALGRLRELLDDPVLVRAGRRMVPSARAERVRPQLARILAEVSQLLASPEAIDPPLLRRSFRLATTDYVETLFVRPVGKRLAHEAPGVDLFCSPIPNAVDRLRSERCDLAFGVFEDLPDDIEGAALVEDELVCVMRRGHPRARGRFTVKQLAAASHVLTAPGGGTRAAVDTLLAREGLSRRVARTAATFAGAAQLVLGTDYLLTLPRRMAEHLAPDLGLVVRSSPLTIPTFTIRMIWHRRHAEDGAHRWLRQQVLEVVSSGVGSPKPSKRKRA